MTKEEAMKLAEEVFDEEYSGLDKDSFLIGFQEAYNALTTLYKEKFKLVRRMREAQKNFNNVRFINKSSEAYKETKKNRTRLESEIDEWLEKLK